MKFPSRRTIIRPQVGIVFRIQSGRRGRRRAVVAHRRAFVGLPHLLTLLAWAAGSPLPESLAVIAVDGCDEGVVSAHARTIREALAKRMGAVVQSEERTVRPLAGSVRGSTADGERLLAGAWQDWGTLQWDRAERGLRVALEAFWSQPVSEARWRNLREAYLLLALVQQNQGKTEEAEGSVQRVRSGVGRYVSVRNRRADRAPAVCGQPLTGADSERELGSG